MDVNSMNNLFSYITLAFGLYCLYAWYQLGGGKIPEKFVLLPKDLSPDKCLDQELYISYIRPRLIIFGVVIVLFSGFSLVDTRLNLIGQWFPTAYVTVRLIATSLVPLAIIIWFGYCLVKIQRELW